MKTKMEVSSMKTVNTMTKVITLAISFSAVSAYAAGVTEVIERPPEVQTDGSAPEATLTRPRISAEPEVQASNLRVELQKSEITNTTAKSDRRFAQALAEAIVKKGASETAARSIIAKVNASTDPEEVKNIISSVRNDGVAVAAKNFGAEKAGETCSYAGSIDQLGDTSSGMPEVRQYLKGHPNKGLTLSLCDGEAAGMKQTWPGEAQDVLLAAGAQEQLMAESGRTDEDTMWGQALAIARHQKDDHNFALANNTMAVSKEEIDAAKADRKHVCSRCGAMCGRDLQPDGDAHSTN